MTKAEIIRDPALNDLPIVYLDRIWMKEVFRNLIENAVKFNTRPPCRVSVSACVKDRMLEVSFTDNGPGIPSEERAKIFNKFYQIDGSFTGQVQGMGLGLTLVKRVVDEHGGKVDVQSELGKGTTFLISLPLQ
jgi:signal transduction histidine kinase